VAEHGVVLGGGGVVGIAWEVGVLAALRDAGLTPLDDAIVVVGTSAGSLVSSTMLRGASLAQLEALQQDPAPSPRTPAPEPDLEVLGELFNTWTAATQIDEEIARRVCELALRAPTISEDDLVTLLTPLLPDGAWPDRALLVTAVACSTGRRTVWSSASGVDLRRAVASSCSVPGLFPPMTVDPAAEERYVDGGLWSGTNADLVLDHQLDAVVIIESMSVVNGQLGALSKRTLDAEITALEAAGVRVATVSPAPVYGDLGPHLMDPARRADGLEIGRADGTAAVPAVRELLAG
jgi:NTE family protein